MISVNVAPQNIAANGYLLQLGDYKLPLAASAYLRTLTRLLCAVNFLLLGGMHAECRFADDPTDKLLVLDRQPDDGVQLSVFALADRNQLRRPPYKHSPEFSCNMDLQEFARALNRGVKQVT